MGGIKSANGHAGRRKRVCPTCGRPFAPSLIVHGPVRARLLDAVALRPDGITVHELANAIYADDPDGGPLWATRSIAVTIKRANSELMTQGHRIVPTHKGRGARYLLVRLR